MKTYLHTLAAALLAPCALFAGTVELTVDADTTLSAALAAEGKTLSSGDTLVKKGLGKLTSDQVFADDFKLAVTVSEGVLEITAPGQLGFTNQITVENDATLTNVTINESGNFYALWITGDGQTVTVTDSKLNAPSGRGVKVADEYVNTPESVTLNITDTEITSAKKAAVLVTSTAGAAITATDVDISGVAADSSNIVWVDEDRSTKFGEVTLNGGQTYPEGGPTAYAATLSSDGKIEGYYKSLDDVVADYEEGDTITALNYVEGKTVVPEGWVAKTNGDVTTLEEAPKGTITVGYVNASRGVWGEADSNAKESFSVKVYSGETLLGTTTLNNIGGIIDGSVNVTWSALLPSQSDEYWTTVWEENGLAWDKPPTTVELWVDGVKVAENVAQLNGPDGINPVKWWQVAGVSQPPISVVRNDVVVDKCGTIADALAVAKSGDVVSVPAGEFELKSTAVIPAGVALKGAGKDATTFTISTTNGDGVKITNPNVTISDATINGSAITSSNYNSLINVEADGVVIDSVVMTGGGKSTWNSSILVETLTSAQTFTVKNSTISGSFRGVLRESCNANIVIENCDIDAVYPFNIDGGSHGTVTVTDSALHGWTSYSGVDSVTFTNCEFSKAKSGYDCVAAYVDTTFDGCTFDSNFDIYAQTTGFTFELEDCTKNGVALTWEKMPDNFGDADVWNKCTCLVDHERVAFVAQIGDTVYNSLDKAITAAQEGETVKLIADVAYELTSTSKIGVTIDKSITLDGNGHKITLTGEYAGGTYGIHVDSTAAITPTFKNLTIAASGIERAVRFDRAAGGTLDNVTLTTDAVGIHIKGTGDVEISNSSITTKPNDNTHYTAHLRSAVMHGSSATVTLTNNTIVAQAKISSAEMNHKAKGVYVGTGAVGTAVLESGNAITADIALAIDGAETGAGAGPSNKNHLIVQAGNTVTGAWASTGYKFKLLTIDGGDYYDLSTPDLTTLGKADSDGNLQISVTGGTFPIDVTDYCAEGYTCVPSEDRYVVQVAAGKVARNVEQNKAYASLADAFAEATAGQTVQLLVDQANLGTVAIPANVILDGNGLTLSGTSYLAVNAAGGTVKNVNFNAIGARNATTPAITANDLAGALVVESCTFANGKTGYNAETDVAVTTVADASVKIIGNTFTGKTEKNYVIVQGAAAYAAEITGNVFNAGAKTRAFAVVNGGENVVASGNYVADGLYFGVSTNGVNGSELTYPQLASPTAATAEKAIPTFIVKNSPDGYPAIKGYAALADAFTDAVTGETILMTADATLDAAAVAASKSLVLDGQGFTLTASSDWSMKGTKAATSSPDGSVTLQNITLKYDAASDYAAARLGGNVTLGENVVIDASSVITPNAVLATGIAVAAGATPEVKAGSAVQAGDTLISALTLGEGASVEVSGLPTGLFDAIADNALALRTQEATVTVGETVTYYNTLQDALNAAVTATSEPLVEALVDEIDATGWSTAVFGSASKLITFDGHDVTIKNLDAPLFDKSGSGAKGVVVKNVTVKNANIQSTSDYAAVFVPYADSTGTLTFENCNIVDSNVTGNKYVGGFVGFNSGYNVLSDGPLFNNVTIKDCDVTGSTFTSNKGSVGSLMGHAAANAW